MIRTIKSGKVIEKSQFFAGEKRPRKPRRKGGTSASKKDSNLRCAERRLAQTINCNFEKGDLFLTLTYDDEHLSKIGLDTDKADRECALFVRRLSRELGRIGIRQQLLWITADKDELTFDPVRLHHHVIIKRAGFEIFRDQEGKIGSVKVGSRTLTDIWGQGLTSIEILREQDDYTPLAVYLCRQALNGPDAKKWHPSRGLEKPIVKNEVIVTRVHELRAPGGADVKEIGRFDLETGSHYIRYIEPPKKEAKKQRDVERALEELTRLRSDLKSVSSVLGRKALEKAIAKKEQELVALGG